MSFRKEDKLKIHHGQMLNFFDWMYENGGVELHPQRTVSSTYFDNDEWRMFHDSEEGCVPRKKIRVRSYSTDRHRIGTSALEIKVSSIEGRYKTTSKDFDLEKIMKIGFFDQDYGICKTRVRVSYRRSYYKIFGVRLTIDQNIEYASVYQNRDSAYKITDPEGVVEIKAAENISPDFLNKSFPFDRVRFSKYSRAVTCLMSNRSSFY